MFISEELYLSAGDVKTFSWPMDCSLVLCIAHFDEFGRLQYSVQLVSYVPFTDDMLYSLLAADIVEMGSKGGTTLVAPVPVADKWVVPAETEYQAFQICLTAN